MIIYRYISLIFAIIFFALDRTFAETVWIYNQDQFDSVVKEINSGFDKDIRLSSGTYILKEKILAKNSLSITGNNSVITWNNDTYSVSEAISETTTHYVCKIKSPINPFSLFVDEKDNIVNVSESVDSVSFVNRINQEIIGENIKKTGLEIKIPIADNLFYLRNKKFSNKYGYFECGWGKVNFIVNKSDNKYFYCKTIETTNVNNFNYDLKTYHKDIRYILFNIERKTGCVFYDQDYIYIPKNINRIYCINCVLYDNSDFSIKTQSNISFEGIIFKNFNGISVFSKSQNICSIKNCSFLNTLGYGLYLKKENVGNSKIAHISNCRFYSCSLISSYIVSLNSGFCNRKCILFDNCIISRYPNNIVLYKNCNGALAVNADADIINNTIYNSPRTLVYLCNGDINIRGNIIYNSKEFNLLPQRNLSNDFGLIYCGYLYKTLQEAIRNDKHRILIEANLIYGAHGYYNDARGVMLDSGRGDVICRNNVVLDTESYSLDSRDAGSFVSISSIRNVFESNIVANRYRLSNGIDVPDKYLATSDNNILLGEFKNIRNRIRIKHEDTVVLLQSNIYGIDGKVHISNLDYNRIKKINNWRKVKHFFIQK